MFVHEQRGNIMNVFCPFISLAFWDSVLRVFPTLTSVGQFHNKVKYYCCLNGRYFIYSLLTEVWTDLGWNSHECINWTVPFANNLLLWLQINKLQPSFFHSTCLLSKFSIDIISYPFLRRKLLNFLPGKYCEVFELDVFAFFDPPPLPQDFLFVPPLAAAPLVEGLACQSSSLAVTSIS